MARLGRDSAPERQRRADERRAAQEAQARLNEQRRQAAFDERERQMAAVYAVDTGIGRCPYCGSTNLIRARKTEDDGAAQSAACCCGCAFFLPLLLLIPFLRQHYTVTRCRACGQEWPT